MHRGRQYPQVLDRMLSTCCTPPFFAPLSFSMDLTFTGPLGTTALSTIAFSNATSAYGLIGIRWDWTSNYFGYPIGGQFIQQVRGLIFQPASWTLTMRFNIGAFDTRTIVDDAVGNNWYPGGTLLPWQVAGSPGIIAFDFIGQLRPDLYF